MPEAAVVGVLNEPSKEGWALRVLAEADLIKLKDVTGILETVVDVVENSKKFEVKELDAGIVGHSVEHFDAAVVNADWTFAARPMVLFSDEVTSALDPETKRFILALLKDLNRGLRLMILLITHEMEVFRSIAHRVAVIDA